MRASGDVPYIFDRNGKPIGSIRANEVVADDDAFAALLNRDAGSFAEEVEHKRAKRMLLAELQPIRPKTQHSPEPDL